MYSRQNLYFADYHCTPGKEEKDTGNVMIVATIISIAKFYLIYYTEVKE